jgi:hypothetical protein
VDASREELHLRAFLACIFFLFLWLQGPGMICQMLHCIQNQSRRRGSSTREIRSNNFKPLGISRDEVRRSHVRDTSSVRSTTELLWCALQRLASITDQGESQPTLFLEHGVNPRHRHSTYCIGLCVIRKKLRSPSGPSRIGMCMARKPYS